MLSISSRARGGSVSEDVFRAAGKWLAAFVLVSVTAGFGSCSGGGGGGGGGGPQGYLHLQGSVSGLLPGQSVFLQLNGGDTTEVPANESFQFSALLATGAPYSVTVLSQPTGEICSTVNGSGTGTVGTGSGVTVACTPGSYSVSGTVIGATGPVVLQLYLPVNDSTTTIGPPLTVLGTQVNAPVPFTLVATAPFGTPFEVGVPGDPPYEQCGVDDNTPVFGSGEADVTGAVVNCGWLTGVTVSGLLPNSSVTLGVSYENLNNGPIVTAPVTVAANGDCGAQCIEYATVNHPNTVAVTSQPVGETCTVGAAQGTPGQGEVIVPVVCTPGSYTVSGTVIGLSGSVVLQLVGNDGTTPIGPAVTVLESQFNTPVPFTLSATVPLGTPFEIAIPGQPSRSTEEACGVDDATNPVTASGPGTANVTNAVVTCGWVSEVTVSGLLPNASVTLQMSTVFLNEPDGAVQTYSVTTAANGFCGQCNDPFATVTHPDTVAVASQPVGETCTVGAPQGTIGQTVITLPVVCTPGSYTIGGTVSGLSAGNSVVLENNGGNATTVSANGVFTFTATVGYQSPYAVTVSTQPTGQNCSVTNGSGTLAGANVTSVSVVCTSTTDAGLWTWESGSNMPEFLGVYGTLGTAAPGNVPGGREAAFSWTDSAGNLWMFGGIGAGNSGVGGSFNDLWRYSPSTGLWAWMSGADTLDELSVYGTKGTAAAGNVPSAREGGAAWTDSAGNFWMFGGGGFDSAGSNGALNDLWRYSPSSGLWTWMSGATTGNLPGVYGTQGTPAPGNVPGARSAIVSWEDSAGNFWLFGGAGFDSTDLDSYLNDLWRYSPSTNQWTWMSGSAQADAAGVYGTQGTASAGNVPGARAGAVSWTDGSGNFWMFGGRGHDSNGTIGVLNDLWQYSPTTGHWTWMSGSKLQGAAGVYGTLGIATTGNVPGARQDAVSWSDNAGNLWLFGYGAFDSSGNFVSDGNDLWRYSPSTSLWTWMGGSTTQGATGVYGTEGVAAPSNVPAARDIGLPWTDNAGNFWLFGGYVPSSALNDLWKFVPPGP